jgi:hypothetical protein
MPSHPSLDEDCRLILWKLGFYLRLLAFSQDVLVYPRLFECLFCQRLFKWDMLLLFRGVKGASRVVLYFKFLILVIARGRLVIWVKRVVRVHVIISQYFWNLKFDVCHHAWILPECKPCQILNIYLYALQRTILKVTYRWLFDSHDGTAVWI